ncbi:unnamed protein product, partial [Choristocarpus tenellus]
MLKVEILEVLICGCDIPPWSISELHSHHHKFLLHCIGICRWERPDIILSCKDALRKTGCESIEAMVRNAEGSYLLEQFLAWGMSNYPYIDVWKAFVWKTEARWIICSGRALVIEWNIQIKKGEAL